MKVLDLLEKIELGENDFDITVWWDYISKRYHNYNIILKCDGEELIPSSVTIDDKNEYVIFNIELSDIDDEIEKDIAYLAKNVLGNYDAG